MRDDINSLSSSIIMQSRTQYFVLKYADILWNRTFGCIGRQAFNYYCSLLQV